MQVSVEELGALERRMTVQVPAERIDKEVNNRLRSLTPRVKVDGFRPGKVPLKLVKRMYGPRVRQEVLGDMLKTTLEEALTEKDLHLAGGPKIDPKTPKEGEDFEYSATFEVMPQFEVQGTEGIEVERPVAEITESDIDRMLETLRKQRATWHSVERPSQSGDRVTLDFEGKIEGEDFPGNKRENASVVLGEGRMVKNFEDRLVGLDAGAETELDIDFPEDYGPEEVAGRTAHFSVRIKTVEEPRLPEVDEQFAADFGVQEGGVEGLRKAVRENMERELREAIKVSVKQQIMQGLLEVNDIPLPQAMVDNEADRLIRQADLPKPETDEEAAGIRTAVDPEARRRVALGLVISKLVASQSIQVDQQRVRAHLQDIASTYEDPAAVIEWYSQHGRLMEGIHALALEDQVVDWLMERAKVTDKPSSFEGVMRPAESRTPSAQEVVDYNE